MTQFIALFQAAIVFGTVILYGALGEILTEKSGNLNLGVPGIMYLGGIAGLATIEDTIEQIVGELEDEHDRTQHADPEQIGENKWSMPARTPIADLEEIFEIVIDEDDVDTVYGLLTKLLGRVPIVGSTAVTRGLRLTAVDSAGRRKKVSTIVVEPAHVEGVDETEQHVDHTNGAEEASHDDKDSKDKHD